MDCGGKRGATPLWAARSAGLSFPCSIREKRCRASLATAVQERHSIFSVRSSPTSSMTHAKFEFDIVIVGAGPAGLGAACAARSGGRRVAVVDDTPWLGG